MSTPVADWAEGVFFRDLHALSNRIHNTDSSEQIMLDLEGDICTLLQADRMTLYTVAEDGRHILSRIRTGLGTLTRLRLAISSSSIAGYVAMSRQLINVPDVQDTQALQILAPGLRFLKAVDERSGYQTRQLLTAPIVQGETLYGVLQLINTRDQQPFGVQAEKGIRALCRTLAIAFRKRLQPLQPTTPYEEVDPPVGPLPASSAPPAAPVAPAAFAPPALGPAAATGGAAHPGHVPGGARYQDLVERGLMSPSELVSLLAQAREQGCGSEELLLRRGLSCAQVGASLAAFFGVPYVPYRSDRLRIEALHASLKRDFVLAQGWLPLEETEEGLQVMCLDPEAAQAARMVRQVFTRVRQVRYLVTTAHEFAQSVEQMYGAPESASVDSMLAGLSDGGEMEDEGTDSVLASAAADNELVKLVNKIVVDAYHQGASDIHIEPQPGKAKTQVRFRIDGSLRPYIEIPAAYRAALVTRIKIMCDLDISERRKPQDGKIQFRRFGPLDIELRVATVASVGGVEDVVLRLLKGGEPLPLEQLGLSAHNLARLVPTISKPYGLFYVCGPTGSGKTTTLHSILKHLNTADAKIWTAEDPVEITQKGLRQVQVNKKAGIDFATVMRAFLRLDPDIIMVGESRDLETVSMGIEASLTGHLVLSTLHTNSAPESIVRLLDMGMDPFNFADALLGVLAQRLAKKLCACKERYAASEADIAQALADYSQPLQASAAWQQDPEGARRALQARWQAEFGDASGTLHLYRAVGCATCQGSGYKGRIGLHELLVADDATKRHIQARSRVADMFGACLQEGMRTLLMDGMEKAFQGLTDLKQVRQVCIK